MLPFIIGLIMMACHVNGASPGPQPHKAVIHSTLLSYFHTRSYI